MTMSESDRRAEEQELARISLDFQRLQREYREDLNLRRNQELQALFERANRVIKQIAEAEKFDLILQEAVYRSPRLDITDARAEGAGGSRKVGRRARSGRTNCSHRAAHERQSRAYSLREIVERFGGEIVGDPRTSRSAASRTLENAGAGAIAFLGERALPARRSRRRAPAP